MKIGNLGSLIVSFIFGVLLSTIYSRAKYMLEVDQSNVTTLKSASARDAKCEGQWRTATCQTSEY